MDVNLPRDKTTGKTKGFGFLMYEDQRSTVLAVDNLNGARVLDRTLRVDHVKNYKQPKVQNDGGEWVDPEAQNLNAKPEPIVDEAPEADSEASSVFSVDPEDPMRDYLIEKRKEMKAMKKSKKSKKVKRKGETPEERQARKERRREKKKSRKEQKKSEGVKGVEELLKTLGSADENRHAGRHMDNDDRDRRHDKYRSPERDQRRSPPPSKKRRRDTSLGRSPARDSPRDIRMRSGSSDRDARAGRWHNAEYESTRPESRGYSGRD